jgi:hypothetical protein
MQRLQLRPRGLAQEFAGRSSLPFPLSSAAREKRLVVFLVILKYCLESEILKTVEK